MKRRKPNRKIVIGITGSFGSGKTTVARIFGSMGARVIDADRIGHSLLDPGSRCHRMVVNAFGKRIIGRAMRIDRRRLAKIVFADKKLLCRLNSILHPVIISQIRQMIDKINTGIIVLDAPLLLETGQRGIVDILIAVRAGQNIQIERLTKRTGLLAAEIRKRIRSQMPAKEKVRMADFVIDNSRSLNETKKQVREIRRNLWKN